MWLEGVWHRARECGQLTLPFNHVL